MKRFIIIFTLLDITTIGREMIMKIVKIRHAGSFKMILK